MKILITSGGLSERIDTVRRITNGATGRLGRLIADRFLQDGAAVTYVCPASAARPESGAALVTVDGVSELEAAVRSLCGAVPFDAVIHAMAVSDYRVSGVTAAGRALSRAEKISSDWPELTLTLTATPKVIALFQRLAPQASLVGFKLLDNAPEAELFRAARALMRRHKCAFVLANDARDIGGGRHVGHLLSAEGGIARFETKNAIAEGIFHAVTSGRNGQRSGV
ncbi:MAG: hypothetical protein LBT60_02395 [Oscillospiraceae bacterium]|jgi:phosphopantothenate-cysteine ligase|nr:hypothetical protein [Oscillospiraceae bacterium]